MQDFILALNKGYGINITALKPRGPVWKVVASQGAFCLKRTKQDHSHLLWLAKTIDDLITAGFDGLLPLLLTVQGSPYWKYNNQLFILTRWLEGEKPNFTSFKQRQTFAQLYAKLHCTSAMLSMESGPSRPDWSVEYQKRAAFLKSLKLVIPNQKKLNRTDRTILSWLDYFGTQAEFAIHGLFMNQFDFWNNQPTAGGFCHNDPAPANIIIERSWFLIDYELSKNDLFIRELATLLLRMLRMNRWNHRIFEELCEGYQRERNMSEEELRFLPYLLAFPHGFWRICSQRFEENLPWSERKFASRIWELVALEKERSSFLREIIPDFREEAHYIQGANA
ncbi:CotS family spore coat protein [Hydrogenispora ethanolica]|uniref:CotS family spore coat protein n=1 Tax=Hydrogenispora ethanolica TaxID=1082276 RepID=A0A4R1QZ61_HYDET|nr:CotS family spore coat protein [Hydrogenispora ethanolica]TCL58268.1 CotS family spore coat protein [Hydrogenispora ethanolica]